MDVEDETPVAVEVIPTVIPFHDMTVAQLMFELSISSDRVSASEKVVLREKLMEQITAHSELRSLTGSTQYCPIPLQL
jgi:hypothetical protein